MPTRILITNQKGGVGKSTTTVNLAGAFAATGYRVGVLDTDSQQTTAGLLSAPGHAKSEIRLIQSPAEEEECDVILADSAPRANEPAMITFMEKADLICLVTKTSYVDLLSTQTTYNFLSQLRPNKRYCLLINEIEPRTRLGRAISDNLKLLELQSVPIINHRIEKREIYRSAVVEGWAYLAKNEPKAVGELAMVAGELLQLANR